MRFVLALLLLASPLAAQYPVDATALRWEGATSSAGPFCWGFSCTPEQASVVPGESGTLMIRGELNQVYVIGMSAGANRCLSIPNMFNALVLDDPIHVLFVGITDTSGGILACPDGTDTLDIVIPPGFPPGFDFSLQGLVTVPSGPGLPHFSLTQTITFSVI